MNTIFKTFFFFALGITSSAIVKADISLILGQEDSSLRSLTARVPNAKNGTVFFEPGKELIDFSSTECDKNSDEYQNGLSTAAGHLSNVIQFAASCPNMGKATSGKFYECTGEIQANRYSALVDMFKDKSLPYGLAIRNQFASFTITPNSIHFAGNATLTKLGILGIACFKGTVLKQAKCRVEMM